MRLSNSRFKSDSQITPQDKISRSELRSQSSRSEVRQIPTEFATPLVSGRPARAEVRKQSFTFDIPENQRGKITIQELIRQHAAELPGNIPDEILGDHRLGDENEIRNQVRAENFARSIPGGYEDYLDQAFITDSQITLNYRSEVRGQAILERPQMALLQDWIASIYNQELYDFRNFSPKNKIKKPR